MIDVKSEYKRMLDDIEGQSVGDVYKLQLLTYKPPYIIAGIDPLNKERQLYIDIGDKSWERTQLNSLPKWRGLSCDIKYMEQIGPLKDCHLLVLRQETEQTEQTAEIFEDVLQSLINHIEQMDEEEALYATVFSVLDRWRHFFSRGGSRKLTEEQQRGLFAELYYILEWMKKFPQEPPLIIENWQGPRSGRVDIVNFKQGIEIKSCSDKLRKEIKISNEKQLKLSGTIDQLYLYVCYIEANKSKGLSLQMIIEEIRNLLLERSGRLLLFFNDLLVEAGFKEQEYNELLFYVSHEEVYEVMEDFPRLLDSDLPAGITHVSYNIDLTHCEKFLRDRDLAFNSL